MTNRFIPIWIFVGMLLQHWVMPIEIVHDADRQVSSYEIDAALSDNPRLKELAIMIKLGLEDEYNIQHKASTDKEIKYALKHNEAIID